MTTQNGDILLVYRAVSGTADSGQNLNIVQHSSASSGLRLVSVNSTFSGSLTVTQNLSATTLTCINLSANNASLSVVNVSTLICSGILKFPNGTLSTTYNEAKVVLWANATLPSSVDWFGLGIYNSEIPFKLLGQKMLILIQTN